MDLADFLGFGSSAPSTATASFSFSWRGFAAAFLGAGALFCFLALGGVMDKIEPS